MRTGKKNNVLKYKATEKTHATLYPKKQFPMYIDHIHFLTKKAWWKVTKVHNYYTFEQEPFKKEYILGNQRARQEAVARGDDVQANFWKLLNNADFGFDCRDNSQNKSLHLIYDEEAEFDFISKYDGYSSTNCFLNLDAKIKNIKEYYSNMENLTEDERPYAETLKQVRIERVTENFNKRKSRSKSKLLSYEGHLEDAYANKAYTFVQDLEDKGVNSVKGVACKKKTMVRVSTASISSKLLINAKISIASFIYDCIDTFSFPNEETSLIYARHKIIKVLPYLLMTDTDLGSLEFVVIAEDSCDCGEREMRDILLIIFLENDIQHRLDLSGEFFEQFDKRNEAVRKQVGLCEFENIEHGIVCPFCVNPKEYFELYGILYETNKKHRRFRKGTKGMDFDNYASRILTMEEAEEGSRRFAEKQKQTCFQNTKGNMVMVTIEKCDFGQLNEKQYILPDGISSLPYGHKDLTFIENFKDELSFTPEKLIKFHRDNLFRLEHGILQSNESMRDISSVLLQQPIFYKRGTLKRSQFQTESNTREFLLHGL